MDFDFDAIPKELSSLDDVPDLFRGFYRERKDGEGFELSDLAALRNSLARAKQERNEAKEKAASADAWTKLGETPDIVGAQITEYRDRIAELEAKGAKGAPDPDSDTAALQSQLSAAQEALAVGSAAHAEELAGVSDQLKQREAQFMSSIASRDGLEAISVEGGNSLLLRHLVDPLLKAIPKGAGFETIVLKADGEGQRFHGDGKPFSARDLVKELRADTDLMGAFKGTGISGTGATAGISNGGLGRKTMTRAEFDGLSHRERHAKMNDGFTLTE